MRGWSRKRPARESPQRGLTARGVARFPLAMFNSNTIVKPTVLDLCKAKHGLHLEAARSRVEVLLSSIRKRLPSVSIVTTTAGYDPGAPPGNSTITR